MTLKKEYVEKDGQTYKISLGYELGGINWANGQTNSRGYYIYCQPVTIEHRDGYTTESMMLFSGLKKCLAQVERQSKKIATELVAEFGKHRDEMLELYLQKNLEKATI